MNGNNAKPIVTCDDVVKIYGSGNAEVHALQGVDLEVYPGDLTMLVGPSGCGKTTLLSVVAGILGPRTAASPRWKLIWRAPRGGARHFAVRTWASCFSNSICCRHHRGRKRGHTPGHSGVFETQGHVVCQVATGKDGHGRPREQSSRPAFWWPAAACGNRPGAVHRPQLLVCNEPTSARDHKTGHAILELLRSVAIEGDRAGSSSRTTAGFSSSPTRWPTWMTGGSFAGTTNAAQFARGVWEEAVTL